ncbi:hypothetical protein D3C81_1980840 [compost metagenome]
MALPGDIGVVEEHFGGDAPFVETDAAQLLQIPFYQSHFQPAFGSNDGTCIVESAADVEDVVHGYSL